MFVFVQADFKLCTLMNSYAVSYRKSTCVPLNLVFGSLAKKCQLATRPVSCAISYPTTRFDLYNASLHSARFAFVCTPVVLLNASARRCCPEYAYPGMNRLEVRKTISVDRSADLAYSADVVL